MRPGAARVSVTCIGGGGGGGAGRRTASGTVASGGGGGGGAGISVAVFTAVILASGTAADEESVTCPINLPAVWP